MPEEIKITGAKELNKILSKLPERLERNVLRAAIRAGGREIVKEARNNVPIDSGNLKKSIGIKIDKERGTIIAHVGPRKGKNEKNDGWYAHFIEFGTVNQSPQPFMRPAFDAKKIAIIKSFGVKIQQALLKIK